MRQTARKFKFDTGQSQRAKTCTTRGFVFTI